MYGLSGVGYLLKSAWGRRGKVKHPKGCFFDGVRAIIELHNGDCLELMKDIPDGSVDLVLTDPPYNIGKAKWDKIPDYINWCGKWIKECERALKNNGSFYFWHNDMPQIAQLMEWMRQNTKFKEYVSKERW